MMVYTDAHCHLGSRQFDVNREEMINRMLENNVRKAIIICCSRHDLSEGLKLRRQYPDFKLAISIHPQDLEDDYSDDRLTNLKKTIQDVHPDMIGETGLDYRSHPHTKAQQLHFFNAQLEMAEKYQLPVNIHCRKASQDTLDILKAHHCKGIIHSYSGSIEMARLFIKEGYYISFGASVLFPNSHKPQQVIAGIPLERLLIETDSPYQSPARNHIHEPSDVINIYRSISQIRNIPLEQLIKQVEDNFDNVFSF